MNQFDAFISYSHQTDSQLAAELKTSLQRFGKPIFKLRAMRVFRDQTNLSIAPHLWGNIEAALASSSHFLLLASPQAAQSQWVRQEVEFWKRQKNPDTLYIILTGGDLVWDGGRNDFDWSRTTALPDNLGGLFPGEPLYLDMRWTHNATQLTFTGERFVQNVARIVAAIRGRAVDDVYGEEIRRYKRTRRLRNTVITVLSVLTVALGGASTWALNRTAVARGLNSDLQRQVVVTTQQRERADSIAGEERKARAAAEAQLGFVGGLLENQLRMRDLASVGPQFIRLSNVYFAFDSTGAPQYAREQLDRVGGLLRSHPNLAVRVAGHFAEYSEAGTPVENEYALAMSNRRAASIKQYLVNLGAPAERISTEAHGKNQPLIAAPNPEERINSLVRGINSRAEILLAVQ